MVESILKRAIVLGCSSNVWQEYEAALKLFEPDTVYCVKLAGVHWQGGRFNWVGLHPEFCDDYEAQRASNGYHSDYEIVAPLATEVGTHGAKGRVSRRVSYLFKACTKSPSSGAYAAKVAIEDGHDKVVLAGVPMVAEAGHFTRQADWKQCNTFLKGFEEYAPHFGGRVRSLSGWTQKLLGAPTVEWLAEG